MKRIVLIIWLGTFISCQNDNNRISGPDSITYWCKITQPATGDTLKISQEFELVAEFGGFTKPVHYGFALNQIVWNPNMKLDDTASVNRITRNYSFSDTGWQFIAFKVRSDIVPNQTNETRIFLRIIE